MMKTTLLTCTTLLAATFMPFAIAAECKPFHVQVVDTRVTPCASLYCTSGTIDGNHGLNGTIDAAFDSFAAGPATTPEPARTVSFSSISVIRTASGSLTSRETGISSAGAVSADRRFFAGWGEVIATTGDYAGATGHFWFAGHNENGINITDTMVGELCKD